jgi:hypothetical protein
MTKKEYINLRLSFKSDHLNFLYNYCIGLGFSFHPAYFQAAFQAFQFNGHRVIDLLNHLDKEHESQSIYLDNYLLTIY